MIDIAIGVFLALLLFDTAALWLPVVVLVGLAAIVPFVVFLMVANDETRGPFLIISFGAIAALLVSKLGKDYNARHRAAHEARVQAEQEQAMEQKLQKALQQYGEEFVITHSTAESTAGGARPRARLLVGYGRYKLLRGSFIRRDSGSTFPKSYYRLRERICSSNAVSPSAVLGYQVLTRDMEFKTSTGAAVVVLGAHARGGSAWRHAEDGARLDNYRLPQEHELEDIV